MPYKNIAERLEYQKLWLRERRKEFFRGKMCIECGSTTALEIDHIDSGLKISHRIWGWCDSRRRAELEKCQVLCRTCHIKKTWTVDRDRAKCGSTAQYGHGCRCQDCVTAKSQSDKVFRDRKRLRLYGSVV